MTRYLYRVLRSKAGCCDDGSGALLWLGGRVSRIRTRGQLGRASLFGYHDCDEN